jgi:hypothetical protein
MMSLLTANVGGVSISAILLSAGVATLVVTLIRRRKVE